MNDTYKLVVANHCTKEILEREITELEFDSISTLLDFLSPGYNFAYWVYDDCGRLVDLG